jgi:hypothetical protein
LSAGLGLRSASTTNLSEALDLHSASFFNSNKRCSASQLAANEHKGLFNFKTASTFKLIFGFKQQYQSQLQHLVDLSLSNASLIAKFESNSIKAKANSAKLIDMPTSQRSAMINLNNGSSQFVVKYIFLSGSEGAHTACRFIVELDAAAKSVQAVRLPMLVSVPTSHFEGAQAPSGRQEYSIIDIAFQRSLPIKRACIAPATFDKAFKFIVASTSLLTSS